MSRCFPFPPPGYEKKPRPEEDLLKEEKRKDKKHKKDKKDKEKREGKDKKEKEKSDDKHKEKKDKKEKHRDKKEKHRDKKKDKGKDKEKSSISEDPSVTRLPDTRSGEKLHTREEGLKDKKRGSDEKKIASQFQGQNGQNYIGNGLLARETEESKFVQELGRRIRDEGAAGSKPVERSSGADYRENQEAHRCSVGDPQDLAEDKERNRERRADDRKVEARGLGDEARFSRNTMVQTLAGPAKHKVEGMPVPAQGITEKNREGKNKSKEKGDDKWGEKRKDKKDKKSHGKDKGREKDKKKEERTDIKKIDQDDSICLLRNELTGSKSNNTSPLPTDDHKQFTTLDNLKKRKDVGTNGFLHENELRPNKLPRLTSHQLPENGTILEPSQTPSMLSSDSQGVASQDRTNGKEHWMNGIIEAPSSYVSNQKPPLSATRSDKVMEVLKKPLQADQVVEAPKKLSKAYQVTETSKKHRQADQMAEPSKRPPHPDLKYLSQVLSVPMMDEWSEVDDQDWLFSSKVSPSKKPEVTANGDNTEQRVWSEALHIESADIYALPYVIPY